MTKMQQTRQNVFSHYHMIIMLLPHNHGTGKTQLYFRQEGSQCHQLGLRGPCRELEILGLHPETLQPRCETDSRVTRSPWYAIPKFRRGQVRVGVLPYSRRQTNCRVNRRGRCQPIYRHPNSFTTGKRNPADYLKMLRYFRGR